MRVSSQLSEAALQLKNGNPQAFEKFSELLEYVKQDALIALTEAPTDEILVHKGRCQQLRWFQQLLSECHRKPTQEPPTPPQQPHY